MGNIENLTGLESPLEVGQKINEIIDTSKSMITNCLLEVPQRIKYELKDGTLTIKAGTVVIVPYGTEEATYNIGDTFLHEKFKIVDVQYENSKLFYWVELLNNLAVTANTQWAKGKHSIAIMINGNQLLCRPNALSGTSTDKTSAIFYNTNINSISDTSITDSVSCFPILTVTVNDDFVINKINNVFNGMGYIGSTVWLDKDIVGLFPNGRNADGGLKNIIATKQKLTIIQAPASTTKRDIVVDAIGSFGFGTFAVLDYIPEKVLTTWFLHSPSNIIYQWNGEKYAVKLGATSEYLSLINIGQCAIEDGVIKKFQAYKPFQVAKEQDIDGYWTYKLKNLVTEVTDFAANGTLTFDLSDYLPDTINVYEILCSVTAETGTTSGDFLNYIVASDIIPIEGTLRICAGQTWANNAATVSGNAIIPCRKTIILNNGSTSIGTSHLNKFNLIAYRKVR